MVVKKQATPTSGGNRRRQNRARRQQLAADGKEKAGHGAKSKAARDKAIVALLSENNVSAAAKKCGVGERTLHRWLSEDETFQAEHADALRTTFEAAVHRAQAITGKAIDTLEELLEDKKHPAVPLGAARTVTEIGLYQQDAEAIMRAFKEIETANSSNIKG